MGGFANAFALYGRYLRFLIAILPLACVVYWPGVAVLGRADPLGAPPWVPFVSPLAGVVFLGVAALAWRRGLRRYHSTGS